MKVWGETSGKVKFLENPIRKRWSELPENLVPFGNPGEVWSRMREKLEGKIPLGGAFSFARDRWGNLWFLQWRHHDEQEAYIVGEVRA
jgi:hypothetical protein